MKKPKTIDGKIRRITIEANKIGYTIRKFWYCKAGWGLIYVSKASNANLVHTYYKTISSCVNGEYNRVVLRKEERGGFCLTEKYQVTKTIENESNN